MSELIARDSREGFAPRVCQVCWGDDCTLAHAARVRTCPYCGCEPQECDCDQEHE
jgi:hypothetical protein